MKLKKHSGVNILLVELIGVIIFFSIAFVIIAYLYTGVYQLTATTKELVVGGRVIQNLAEYSKGCHSKEAYEALLIELGSEITNSNSSHWEVDYDDTGKLGKLKEAKYVVNVVIKSEPLKDGDWVTIYLTAKKRKIGTLEESTIQELTVNQYYKKEDQG